MQAQNQYGDHYFSSILRSLYLLNPAKIKRRFSLSFPMKIIKIISISQYALAIYYTSSDCYKYTIIDEYKTVYEPDDIFYTPEAAEREGREAINTVSN